VDGTTAERDYCQRWEFGRTPRAEHGKSCAIMQGAALPLDTRSILVDSRRINSTGGDFMATHFRENMSIDLVAETLDALCAALHADPETASGE